MDTSVLLGPAGLAVALSKKSKAFVFIAFSDGTLHEKDLDGNMAIRATQREVAQFNALARAARARN